MADKHRFKRLTRKNCPELDFLIESIERDEAFIGLTDQEIDRFMPKRLRELKAVYKV